MREILFRAKRIDNGEWVEGYLFRLSESLNPFIMLKNKSGEGYEVDGNTVCQYTGLCDKNGRKIWQYDIISFLDYTSTESGYSEQECVGIVVWDEETVSFQVTERLSAESYEVLDGCSVIGNIFDNPELLEGN